ncbi:unnamed protein product [Orchesella dallaii]|uniref:Uncharacterized protein n=1 Tax=Orchesella dallaii TaxID=48710 RepID=A0ABP1PRA7_9HEXA
MLLQTLILATAIKFSICGWKEDIRALHYDKPLCSIAKSLYKEKPYEFKLNKRKDLECEYTFLGSISRNCTAEISCNQLDLPPQNSNGVCDNGHIQIGDSFGSQITGCGKLEFGGPYRPSRNGRYLYVRVKGNSAGTVCKVYCGESLKTKFKQLKTYPRYSGRRVTQQCGKNY